MSSAVATEEPVAPEHVVRDEPPKIPVGTSPRAVLSDALGHSEQSQVPTINTVNGSGGSGASPRARRSGFKGVRKHTGVRRATWLAEHPVKGKAYKHPLGLFNSAREAAAAYDNWCVVHGRRKPPNGTTRAEQYIAAKKAISLSGIMGGTSVYAGVSMDRRHGRWLASMRLNGKPVHLGFFTEERHAAAAYDRARVRTGKEAVNGTSEEERAKIPDTKSRGPKSSSYRGVTYEKSRDTWRAKIDVYGKTLHLGNFEHPMLAAEAYNQACIQLGRRVKNDLDPVQLERLRATYPKRRGPGPSISVAAAAARGPPPPPSEPRDLPLGAFGASGIGGRLSRRRTKKTDSATSQAASAEGGAGSPQAYKRAAEPPPTQVVFVAVPSPVPTAGYPVASVAPGAGPMLPLAHPQSVAVATTASMAAMAGMPSSMPAVSTMMANGMYGLPPMMTHGGPPRTEAELASILMSLQAHNAAAANGMHYAPPGHTVPAGHVLPPGHYPAPMEAPPPPKRMRQDTAP